MNGKTDPVGVVAVVMRGNQTLVIRRGPNVPYSGYVAPLSGRLEPGESEAEAVVREVREEVGLEVIPIRRVWECPSEGGGYDLHWWLAEYAGGELVLNEEVSEATWIYPSDFEKLENTFADDRKFYMEVFPHLKELG